MTDKGAHTTSNSGQDNWMDVVSKYNFPDTKKSIWQLVNSIVPYFGILILMYYSLEISYWITIALVIPATGFMTRIFIIFHDCGHRAFFKSPRANAITGFFTGLFTLTGYLKWQRSHNKHHSTVGNLDQRGIGDVKTMTLDEYNAASKGQQRSYRMYRHPLMLLGIGAPYLFILQNRLFSKHSDNKEKLNILMTSLVLAFIITGVSLLISFKTFIIIYLPILHVSAVLGTWLFYMQHQFEDVHWYREDEWDYPTVALNGSSFYKLPRVLQWFSGNIGFHHVHHLSPRIPNYKLEECHRDNDLFNDIKPISLIESLKSFKLRLWDEKNGKLVGFR